MQQPPLIPDIRFVFFRGLIAFFFISSSASHIIRFTFLFFFSLRIFFLLARAPDGPNRTFHVGCGGSWNVRPIRDGSSNSIESVICLYVYHFLLPTAITNRPHSMRLYTAGGSQPNTAAHLPPIVYIPCVHPHQCIYISIRYPTKTRPNIIEFTLCVQISIDSQV